MLILDVGKILILGILIIDLFYFSAKELSRYRETVLMGTLLCLLCIGSLFEFLTDYTSSPPFVTMKHVLGVAFVGITAMLISISAHIRMKKVMKRGVRVITPKHST